MSGNKDSDAKARFKAALESKNSKSNNIGENNNTNDSTKLRASSGNKPKMFRRKSG